MKGTNLTPYELWFGHAPTMKYFKIFGRKFYILKDNRNSKLMQKLRKVFYLAIPLEVKHTSV